MKINFNSSVYLNFPKQDKTAAKQPVLNNSSAPIVKSNFYAYKDYNINFKARLNRTPEDFYSQKFNQENMPDTVRKYLNEDFEERQHMPPSQLQREAFEYIKIADTVEEVKDMYPDEPLFKNLRSFKETNAKRGTLFLLRWDSLTSNTHVFKNEKEKDLSLYLLKKVYLEGKTLEEINKDFAEDSTEAIKKELGNETGDYFSYADLKSMGIKYPKLAYYKSFLATRDDKEYIPVSRKSGPRNISEETLEKMREGRKSWWAGLNKTDRDEQIQKMIHGKELANSTFSKYQGQIMTIAAAKIGFSEKLSTLYEERYYDQEFQDDFDTFKERQRAIMEEFWNKDPEFKKVYSDAIQSTIADFDEALSDTQNPEKLVALMNKALDMKAKVLEKAKIKRHERTERQKLAPKPPIQQPKPSNTFDINSKKEITKLFRQQENASLKFYPDMFRTEMLEFIMNNTDFKTKQTIVALNRSDAKEILNINEEQKAALIKEVEDKIEDINQKFNLTHTLTARTNDFVMNNLLYELTGTAEFFKCERGDTNLGIQKNHLESQVAKNKDSLNRQMKQLARPLTDKDAKEYFDSVFMPQLNEKLKTGLKYYPQITDSERESIKRELNKAFLADPENVKKSIKHLSNYNAPIKFLKNKQNNQKAKEIVSEKMATDFLFWFMAESRKQYKQKQDNLLAQGGSAVMPKTEEQVTRTPSLETTRSVTDISDVDLTSLDSLKKAFNKVSKKQCQFFSSEFAQKLNGFLLSHPKIKKEVLIAFVLVESGAINSLPESEISEADKKAMSLIAEHNFVEANKDFDKKYPALAQANEFALNQALYELTKDPNMFKNTRADSALYIMTNDIESKMKEKKPFIEKRYKDFSIGLTDKDVKKFFTNNFSKEILEVYHSGMKYHDDIKKDASDAILSYIFKEMKINKDKEVEFIFDFLKRYKGAVKFISDQSQPTEARDLVNEHIVYDFICEKAENFYREGKKL